jgi:hypothetical protein
MYISEKVGFGEVCKSCKKLSEDSNEHIGPVPIYHIGNAYENDALKILFIGSVAYGWDDILENRFLSEPEQSEQIMEDIERRFYEIIFKESYRYTDTIKAIITKIFGSVETGYSRIAITNVIHCNAGNIRGGAKTHMKYHCGHSAKNFMLTKREIEILKPRNIISLAGPTGGEGYIKEHWGLNLDDVLFEYHPCSIGKGGTYQNYAERTENFLKKRNFSLN